MRTTSSCFLIALVLLGCLAASRRAGALELVDIRDSKHCPEGLTVRSTAHDAEMIDFELVVNGETLTHVDDLYRGRVYSSALLDVSSMGKVVAETPLEGTRKGPVTRYWFRLSRTVSRSSELSLRLTLYEKDGLATIGGGLVLNLHLAGFEPVGTPVRGTSK